MRESGKVVKERDMAIGVLAAKMKKGNGSFAMREHGKMIFQMEK